MLRPAVIVALVLAATPAAAQEAPASRATVVQPGAGEAPPVVPKGRYGLGAGMAFTGCGDRCGLIQNPSYGARAFAIWPITDGLGLGVTADLGLFPRTRSSVGKGLYVGGVLEVSSGYHAPSSFSFWLGFGGYSGESGVGNPCISSSGGRLQVGLRAGTHLSDSVFASLSASAADGLGGTCSTADAAQPDTRDPVAPVEGGLALFALEIAYEMGGARRR